MTRFFFNVLIVILTVKCTIAENKDIMKKALDDLGFNDNWEELISVERGMAFALTAAKYIHLENTIIEVCVIDHLHRLLKSFIDSLCKRKNNVRAASQLMKNPPKADIPARLINARNYAIPGIERDTAKENIETFKFVYRQLMAILENIKKSDNEDVALFKKSLREYGIDSNQVAALAGAKLNSELSHIIPNENLNFGCIINWNDKEAVIARLRFWNINEPDVISVASALHDLRTIQTTV